MRNGILGFLTESDLSGSVSEIDPMYNPFQIHDLYRGESFRRRRVPELSSLRRSSGVI